MKYWQKLEKKLKGWVEGFLKDKSEEELVDILKVIYAICDLKKINKK